MGKRLYQSLRCGERSIYGKVPGGRHDLKWINENRNTEAHTKHRWKDMFMDMLQRTVDVDKVRVLI